MRAVLVRYYWSEAFIASDDAEFAWLFARLCVRYGHPEEIRVGARGEDSMVYVQREQGSQKEG